MLLPPPDSAVEDNAAGAVVAVTATMADVAAAFRCCLRGQRHRSTLPLQLISGVAAVAAIAGVSAVAVAVVSVDVNATVAAIAAIAAVAVAAPPPPHYHCRHYLAAVFRILVGPVYAAGRCRDIFHLRVQEAAALRIVKPDCEEQVNSQGAIPPAKEVAVLFHQAESLYKRQLG